MRASIREFLCISVAPGILIGCGEPSARALISEPATQTPTTPISPSNPLAEYIYLASTDGSGAQKLTEGREASWSPTGERILFHRFTPPANGSIYVINVDGSGERPLAEGEWPSWSPDGKRIIFADDAGIEMMNADGSNRTLVLGRNFRDDDNQAPGLPLIEPVWSPDGKRIAFERGTDWTNWPLTLFVMNVDASSLHHVSMYSGGAQYAEADPAWSPDGSSLAYWSSIYGVTITDVAGGTPRAAFVEAAPFGTGSSPAWSPDGTSLAFNLARSDANPSGSIVVISLRTGTTQRVIPDAYDASYSPDGKRIAFTSTRR